MKLLAKDRQRYQFFRLLQAVSDRERLIEFLAKPCSHGVCGVCEKCDEANYRVNGYIDGAA